MHISGLTVHGTVATQIAFENEVTEGHTGICVVLYLSDIRTRTRHYLYGTHVLFALRLGVEQWTGTWS